MDFSSFHGCILVKLSALSAESQTAGPWILGLTVGTEQSVDRWSVGVAARDSMT